jgi:hypothetical protein
MLAFTPITVNETPTDRLTVSSECFHKSCQKTLSEKRTPVAQISIQDGIIKITELEIQDPKAAAVLAEYPEVRWAEITRRALKIGLGYLKGGGKE